MRSFLATIALLFLVGCAPLRGVMSKLPKLLPPTNEDFRNFVDGSRVALEMDASMTARVIHTHDQERAYWQACQESERFRRMIAGSFTFASCSSRWRLDLQCLAGTGLSR